MPNAGRYDQLGASAHKEEVHAAVAQMGKGLFPGAFCNLTDDVLGGDPDWCCALHSDGAGTKALVAYLVYRETGDAGVFRGIAHDALVMNLDDLACVGADRFLLGNTIGRNRFHVGGDVVREIIAGYEASVRTLARFGIEIRFTGGETADLADAVRTLLVDASMATRLRRDRVIDNSRIEPGDLIVGFASDGLSTYEDSLNSGIGSNGLTLARHVLLAREYAERFPESVGPEIDAAHAYRGRFRLGDEPPGLGMSVAQALCSPTRTYAPILREALAHLGADLHGAIHNTGGGLTKCKSFGHGISYIKDRLFPVPPIFEWIRTEGQVDPREMYQTFNMGHRLELLVPLGATDAVIQIASRFGVLAQVVGRCELASNQRVVIDGPWGLFEYSSSDSHRQFSQKE